MSAILSTITQSGLKPVLKNVYDQMPEPKVVVAFGVCTSSGGVFADCYNVLGGIDKVIPVDVFVPGCPPRPEAMIDGIVKGAVILEEKRLKLGLTPAEKPAITLFPSLPNPQGAEQ